MVCKDEAKDKEKNLLQLVDFPDTKMADHPGEMYLRSMVSEKGRKTMRSSISSLLQRATGKSWENFPWELLDRKLVLKMISLEIDDGSKSPATIRKSLTGLKRIAEEASYMSDGITMEAYHGISGIKPVRGKRIKEIQIIDKELVLRILDDLEKKSNEGCFKSIRDAALFSLLYFTALRLHEVISITPNSIDFKNSRLKVRGKGNKDEFVYFGGRCGEILQAYLAAREKELANASEWLSEKDDEYLLKKNLTRSLPRSLLLSRKENGMPYCSTMNESAPPRILNALSRELIVNNLISRPIRPHDLRHSCATHMNDASTDVKITQQHLRHEIINTTGIYIHTTDERVLNKVSTLGCREESGQITTKEINNEQQLHVSTSTDP